MQDTISTNTESGPLTTGPTSGPKSADNSVKTRLANLLINRVSLSECLNVIRDACVQRAEDIVDNADEETMSNIIKDIDAFENPPEAQDVSGPTGPVDSSGPEITPVEVVSSGPVQDTVGQNTSGPV